MPARRKYTATQRAEAIGIAVASGRVEAERATGIPEETIRDWLRTPEAAELRLRAREEWAGDIKAAFLKAVRRTIALLDDPDVSLRDVADAMEKLGNRYALLSGEATSRTETRAITEGLDDHERAALRDAIDAWTARQPAAEGTGGDPG